MSAEIKFRIEAEQSDIPVRGNAMASGDDAVDKKVEDEILDRLDRGDIWAWADVTIIAEFEGFEGRAYLGSCSYKGEADFKVGGYYEQMQEEAVEDLVNEIKRQIATGKDAEQALIRLGETSEE